MCVHDLHRMPGSAPDDVASRLEVFCARWCRDTAAEATAWRLLRMDVPAHFPPAPALTSWCVWAFGRALRSSRLALGRRPKLCGPMCLCRRRALKLPFGAVQERLVDWWRFSFVPQGRVRCGAGASGLAITLGLAPGWSGQLLVHGEALRTPASDAPVLRQSCPHRRRRSSCAHWPPLPWWGPQSACGSICGSVLSPRLWGGPHGSACLAGLVGPQARPPASVTSECSGYGEPKEK